MRKMDKVFEERGITYEADEYAIMMGAEYDTCQKVIDITNDFIITIWYSAVLDPMLSIYDRRTFELIGQQNYRPEYEFCGIRSCNPWGSAGA